MTPAKDYYDPASITDFLAKVGVDPKVGLSRDEAMTRRTMYGTNRVTPPVNCPSWVCCLLPCLLRTSSMQAYHQAVPKECTVLRRVARNNVRRLCMDATSLVYGDVVELREGDVVGADLRVIECSTDCLVDQSLFFGVGEEEEEDIEAAEEGVRCKKHVLTTVTDTKDPRVSANTLLMATRVTQGTAVGVVYGTGDETVWGQMVGSHEWPPLPTTGRKRNCHEYAQTALDYPTTERKALMTSE